MAIYLEIKGKIYFTDLIEKQELYFNLVAFEIGPVISSFHFTRGWGHKTSMCVGGLNFNHQYYSATLLVINSWFQTENCIFTHLDITLLEIQFQLKDFEFKIANSVTKKGFSKLLCLNDTTEKRDKYFRSRNRVLDYWLDILFLQKADGSKEPIKCSICLEQCFDT